MQNDFFALMLSFDKYVFVGYIVLLVAALVVNKRISSVTTAFVTLCCWQALSVSVSPFLYEQASNDGILYKFCWYGAWTLSNLFFIWMIYQFHLIQKLRATSISIAVSMLILSNTVVQVADFIDRATANSGLIANIYQLFIPASNIAIIPVVIYLWCFEYRKNVYIAAAGA
jgi:hypothetical protein